MVAPDSGMPLWMWGALGALAVLIAGGAVLMLRRRTIADERASDVVIEERTPVTPVKRAPVASSGQVVTPSVLETPAPAATIATMPGMGRHERAALAGPTPDNPFLTRRNRVKRARFYDRQERVAAEAGRPHAWSDRAATQGRQTSQPADNRAARARSHERPGWAPGFKPAFGS